MLHISGEDLEHGEGKGSLDTGAAFLTSNGYRYSQVVPSAGGRYRFRVKAGGSTSTLVASAGPLSPGVWTHATAVYDGSEMRLYQDGALIGSVGKTGNITSDASLGAWIGSNPPNATSRPWDGQIDDLRIYDRVLTDVEINQLAGN